MRSVQTSRVLGGVQLARLLHEPVIKRYAVQPACSLRTTCEQSLVDVRLDELSRSMWEAVGRCDESSAARGGRGAPGGTKVQTPTEYILPDGRKLELGVESVLAADQLFHPRAGEQGEVTMPMQGLAMAAFHAAEAEMHKELMRNIILTGSVSCLSGLPERFEEELRVGLGNSRLPSLVSQLHRLAIACGSTHDRRHSAWVGASILGSMPTHNGLWMSRTEYEELGSALIVHKGMQHNWLG